MQIMSICKQEAAFNGWSFCILIQSSQSDGIRSIESSEYLSSTQTFVHRKTAVPDTFFFEGIVCLRGQGSGYDLSSKRQCSVLQPIARTACVRYCSWAAQRTDHGGVLLYLSGRLAGSKSMRACSEAMNDPCQEETQSSIIFDGLFCSFVEKTKLYI